MAISRHPITRHGRPESSFHRFEPFGGKHEQKCDVDERQPRSLDCNFGLLHTFPATHSIERPINQGCIHISFNKPRRKHYASKVQRERCNLLTPWNSFSSNTATALVQMGASPPRRRRTERQQVQQQQQQSGRDTRSSAIYELHCKRTRWEAMVCGQFKLADPLLPIVPHDEPPVCRLPSSPCIHHITLTKEVICQVHICHGLA